VAPSMPMTPLPYRVTAKRWETADTVTLTMAPMDRAIGPPRPGQFSMLWAFGVGEVPISISGRSSPDLLEHTIRAAGTATSTLAHAPVDDVIGVRGPFGTEWEVERARGGDLLIVAGGIGLAPLRMAIHSALEHQDRFRQVTILVGARSPDDLVFRGELDAWLDRTDLQVEVTVDHAPGGADRRWTGDVGLVTELVRRADISPSSTVALVCGPEVMMRYTAQALLDRGVPARSIRLSAERNMKCAIGHCGHCQLGGRFICLDGPVFAHPDLAPLLAVRER
jgi:anaerobic sulfite reductase subunit B